MPTWIIERRQLTILTLLTMVTARALGPGCVDRARGGANTPVSSLETSTDAATIDVRAASLAAYGPA